MDVVRILLADVSKIVRLGVIAGSSLTVLACIAWWRGISFLILERWEANMGSVLFHLVGIVLVLSHLSIGGYAAAFWSRPFPLWLFLVWLGLSVVMLPVALIFRIANGAMTHGMRLPY